MSNAQHFPLHERVSVSNTLQRVLDLLVLFLLVSLLFYRIVTLHTNGSIWLIALLCESWFTCMWLLNLNAKWSPVKVITHPERLSKRLEDLPPVDIFITTADPTLEPPIVVVNTVLSLLALEYPAQRLAAYVSDDGGSPLTYYALCEASKFAKLWVPFCKKYDVKVRAPFVYFTDEPVTKSSENFSSHFLTDWEHMKNEYQEFSRRIEGAATNYVPFHMDGELADFKNIEKGNHPSIIKVIWENKEEEEDDIPHLIYVSREKRPKHAHHFKAGAMNVLMRVSGVMTNAPYMLNVDCDMFANNPKVILHAMCLLLGFNEEASCGFVQAPQKFYGALEDDPFGNQLGVLQQRMGLGLGGIQGPGYMGTGCFHRRKIIYGSSPQTWDANCREETHDDLSYGKLQRLYGSSEELIESAKKITSLKNKEFAVFSHLFDRISATKEVATCTYELYTLWGKEIGLVYGSITEDHLTGLRIQSMGWKSVYLNLNPPAFLGNAPTGGPASLAQYKRWVTGLLEVLLGTYNPIKMTIMKQLQFRQCLWYMMVEVWALRSVVEFCYALVPAYCLLTNSSFLPKASTPEFFVLFGFLIIYNIDCILEYLDCGLSVRAWWNNQRMQRIYSQTAWLSGSLSVILKIVGLSETIFEVTQKDQSSTISSVDGASADPGRFTFDSSPFFVPGTALVLVHLASIITATMQVVVGRRECRWGLGEVICSAWVMLSFWPFVRGLVGKGSYGIPWNVTWKALILGSLFLQFCWLVS